MNRILFILIAILSSKANGTTSYTDIDQLYNETEGTISFYRQYINNSDGLSLLSTCDELLDAATRMADRGYTIYQQNRSFGMMFIGVANKMAIFCERKNELIRNKIENPTPELALVASSDRLAFSDNITEDMLLDFLEDDSQSPPYSFLIERAATRLQSYGIELLDGGLLFSERISGGNKRCSTKKHSWRVDIEAIIKDSSSIEVLYEALNKPIEVSIFIDGEIGLDGNVRARPSFKVAGKCVRIEKITVDVDIPSIPVEATVRGVISLNPQLVRPEDSYSGNYEIILFPTGRVEGKIEKLHNFDVNADVNFDNLRLFFPPLFSSKISNFLVDMGLRIANMNSLETEIKNALLERMEEYSENKLILDLTPHLGGHYIINLGNIPESDYVFESLFNLDSLPTSAFNILYPDKETYITESLIYSTPDSSYRTWVFENYQPTQ